MRNYTRRILTYFFTPILLTASSLLLAGEIAAGAGSFTTEKPNHRWQPATAEGYDQTVPEGQPWGIFTPRKNQSPYVSEHFKSTGKPTPTHEFWSSAVWKFAVKNLIRNEHGGIVETNVDSVPYSHWMTSSPYTMKFTNRGVNLTYAQQPLLVPYRYEDPNSDKRILPSTAAPKFTAYTYPARIDPTLDPLGGTEFNVQFEGLNAEKTLLDDYSDFSATILLKKPGAPESIDNVKVTVANGSPFIHFEKTGLGNVTFTYFNGMRVIHESNGTLALYLGDVRSGYAIFAPQGTQFNYTLTNIDLKELTSRGKITMSLPTGHTHFSVAILPNEINDIFKAPTEYTEQGFVVKQGFSVNQLPTHIEGTHSPLVVARLVGDFFRKDTPNDGVGVEELNAVVLDYRKHAFTFPAKTNFNYQYNEAAAAVTSTFSIDTEMTENEPGLQNTSLMGLYRHQYINTSNLDFAYSYSTPRGIMKVIKANSFQTHITHNGLIPNLPNALQGAELTRLLALLDKDKNGQWVDGLTQNDVLDTYNNGKELNWMLQLLHIAEQTGEAATAQILMNKIRTTLEDWLRADDWQLDKPYNNSHCEPLAEPARSNCYRDLRLVNEKKYFYYNQEWNSLTGFPASFGSDTELNDHHFHVGYLISAAAAVARYDKSWGLRWKPMVDLLIKDSANWNHQDERFQFLRYFDIYNGYSTANGHLNMDAGGNQESSSESINFAQAVALWGSETGDQTIRDLGIFLYTSEIQAIQQYWFDVDNKVFPKNVYWDNGSQFVKKDFDRASVGLVWHSKADYGTWFSAAPRMIAGINFLPITGASLYLGRMERKLDDGSSIPSVQLIMDRLPENTRFFAEDLYHKNQPVQFQQYDFRRKTRFWDDLMWEAEALVNPQKAATQFEAAGNYVREFDPSLPPLYPNDEVRGEAGESKTHTYHWIYNLRALGTPVKDVTADTPHYAVFNKNGLRTHVAYNPEATAKIVRFSDGVTIQVAAGQLSGGIDVPLAPAVTNLAVSNITTNSARVAWTPLTGNWAGATYHVMVTNGAGATIFNQTVTGSQVEFSQLAASTAFSVKVTSVFNTLNGRSATTAFSTRVDLSVVPAVENLQVSGITFNRATVGWNAIPADYANADYRVRLTSNNALIKDVTSTQSAIQQVFADLTPRTPYTVEVWASNNGVVSSPRTQTFTTPVECDPTTNAYCIEAKSCDSIRIALNRNATWADIRITSPQQSGGFRMPQTTEGQSFFNVTGLSKGSLVSFEFTYFDTAGHDIARSTYTHAKECGLSSSAPSSGSASSSPIMTSSSSTPSSSSSRITISSSSVPSSRSTASSSSVAPPDCVNSDGFTFCHVSTAGNLIVTVSEVNGWAVIHNASGNFQMAAGNSANQFTYTFTNMTNGASVNAWFTVNTSMGARDTKSVNFVYEENTISVPPITSLLVTNVTETQATLSWQAPAVDGLANYRVTLLRGTFVEQTRTTTGGQTSLNLAGLSNGTDYRVEVETLLSGKASPAVSAAFTTPGVREVVCNKQPKDVCTDTVGGALRVSLYGATGWAIIHYPAGNFMMTAGSQGEFFYDIPNVPLGSTVTAWFTANTPTGAYDSAHLVLAHP